MNAIVKRWCKLAGVVIENSTPVNSEKTPGLLSEKDEKNDTLEEASARKIIRTLLLEEKKKKKSYTSQGSYGGYDDYWSDYSDFYDSYLGTSESDYAGDDGAYDNGDDFGGFEDDGGYDDIGDFDGGDLGESNQHESAKTRSYKGKKYTASAGSLASLKKHDFSTKKAVEAGDFDWADDPYAAAQAAYIVAKGKTTRGKK